MAGRHDLDAPLGAARPLEMGLIPEDPGRLRLKVRGGLLELKESEAGMFTVGCGQPL